MTNFYFTLEGCDIFMREAGIRRVYLSDNQDHSEIGYKINYGLSIGYKSPFGTFSLKNGLDILDVSYDLKTLEKRIKRMQDFKLVQIEYGIPLINLGIIITIREKGRISAEGTFGIFNYNSSEGLHTHIIFGVNIGIGGIEGYAYNSNPYEVLINYSNARQRFYEQTGVPLWWR